MAISLVQAVYHYRGADGTNTITISASAAGSILVMAASAGHLTAAPAIDSVTDDKTNAWTRLAPTQGALTVNGGLDFFISEIWWCAAPASGTTSIVAQWNENGLVDSTAEIWEVSGFSSPTVESTNSSSEVAATTNPVGASITVAGTAFIATELLSDHVISVTQPFSGNPFTSDQRDDASLVDIGMMHYIPSSGGTYTPQWDSSNNCKTCSSIVAIKEAVAAGPFLLVKG